jgi:hypothetical protein
MGMSRGSLQSRRTDTMSDIVERLRQPLSMSMFVRREDLDREREQQRKEAADEIEQLREALRRIDEWSRAYPIEAFPEPDLKRANQILEAGGMSIDGISASAMRHVTEGVGRIARVALIKTA